MAVNKIKDYKIINGERIKKSKEEFNKETCNGTKIWYYKCNYRDICGNIKQKKSKKYSTREEAIKEEAKFLINQGESITKSYTFNEIFEEYIEKKKNDVRPQTINRHINLYKHIAPYLGNIKIDKLTLQQYEKFKIELTNNPKIATEYMNRIHKLVISLVNYSDIHFNVTTKIPRMIGGFKDPMEKKKEMQFFTLEEYKNFENVIEDDFWKTFFKTLFYCGLRQGELMALQWSDINFEKGTININKTLTTKLKGELYSIFPPKTKSSYRILPLTENLKNDLKMLYNNYNKLDGFNKCWFVFGGIRPTPETTIQKKKNEYCKLCNNGKTIRIHDFRHSCASLLISKNADPVIVAKYLGHSDVSMTLNRYSHMYKSKLDELINIIDN